MMTEPEKRGDYVTIGGVRHPVTGARQSETAASLLPVGQVTQIDHWDGSEWTTTGTVLHGARAAAAAGTPTIADAAHSEMARRELWRGQAERELTVEQAEAEERAMLAGYSDMDDTSGG